MKKVYSSDNPITAGHILSILEADGIECHLRNASLSGGIGELPINECWPEVWVNHEYDYDEALRLIQSMLSETTSQPEWLCKCGEKIDGHFNTCWSCGYELDNAD